MGNRLQQTYTPNYAGILVNDNAVATTIGLVNSWYKVTVFDTDMPEIVSNGVFGSDHIVVGATADYMVRFDADGESAAANKIFEYNIFEVASATSAITSMTAADPVVVTATAHGFSNGDKVKITGVTTMTEVNDRIFTVADKADNTFELTDDGGASPANDIDGSGFAGAGTGGTAQLVTMTGVHSHRKFSAGGATDIGSFAGHDIVSMTKDDTIEMYTKGVTDTTNFTFEGVAMSLFQLS